MEDARNLRIRFRSTENKGPAEVSSTDQLRIDKRELHSIAQSLSFLPLAVRGLDDFLANFGAISDVGEEIDRSLEAERRIIVNLHQLLTLIGWHISVQPLTIRTKGCGSLRFPLLFSPSF